MQITVLKYQDRIERMKNTLIREPHELCIERAQLITESYKKTKGEPSMTRFAKGLEHILANMTIKIWDDEFLVGNRCSKLVGAPLFPEVRIDTIETDIDVYNSRALQRFLLTDEDKRIIKEEIIPYWKDEDETVQERFLEYLKNDDEYLVNKMMMDLVYVVDTNITNGIGHFFPGHENVLKEGFDGLIKKTEEKLASSTDAKQVLFLEGVLIVLNAVKNYIIRYSDLAKSMAKKETDPERKDELIEISKICNNISGSAPKTFKEAFQLIYFTHVICGIEDGGFAISIGRLDQILYPYYQNDMKNCIISTDDVRFLIECFYLKLITLWNYVLNKGIVAAEGPPIAENLTIGGVNRAGDDATNELSYLLLDCYKELQTVQPTFSVRVHEHTPEELLLKTGQAIKAGASIALFNDEVMIPGLEKLGYTLEDAREYAPIGCVEPVHPTKSLGCTNATQINLVKILELTLNDGVDMFTRRKIGLENSHPLDSYNSLWNEYVKQLHFFLEPLTRTMMSLDKSISELAPQPFLSATSDDCLGRGRDITNGGAIYDFTTTQGIGLATVADSLAVIKKLVFEENLLSIDDLIQLLQKNYRGKVKNKKGGEWRQIFLNKVPKFGNDDDYVDSIAHDVAKMYCEELLGYKNYRGGNYNPGIYSTSFHIALGAMTAASADGRKARSVLSNGVGPTNGADKNGPTSILNSVRKLDTKLQTNGNSLILAYQPSTFNTELFPALIKSFYGPEGGYHIQFNVVGKETLCDAQENPEKHPGLVVRIAGYSVLFNEISSVAQNEIIARTEY